VPASVLYMSMSLDGYIAGPNDGPGNPGGDRFMRLHEWFVRPDGEFFRPSGPAGQLTDELNATGAVLAGRRTVEQVDYWGGTHHGVPIFVPSRGRRGPERAGAWRVHGAACARGRRAGRGADFPDPGAVRQRPQYP
jgi:dihydrofolate reductase